ncbi:hypothetical protein VNI00_018010 [Paramarasmius palmivorus]|uniref:Uncharacterized protein n=1 Tax=Paramarasmius palmivorus TaxID=297713 RepID=A0AAW0B148_9AGAR
MFDVPPSGHNQCKDSLLSNAETTPQAPTITPSIIINMPESIGAAYSRNYANSDYNRSPSQPTHPLSDGISPFDEVWPSLEDFLRSCHEKDCHSRDYTAFLTKLTENDECLCYP